MDPVYNAGCRHRIPRVHCRVTNWPAYEASLRQHGDLTFWLDEAALAGWAAPKRSSAGGQPLHSELAIELVPTLRLVFHLAPRRAEAFSRGVLRLLGAALPIPDHTTLRPRLRSHGATNRLRLGWTARWSVRRIMASMTMISDTSGRRS